jgi:hypothetical protein
VYLRKQQSERHESNLCFKSTRHAFRRACDENPRITITAAQRCTVAQAIVSRFERSFSETELTAAALGPVHSRSGVAGVLDRRPDDYVSPIL